MRIYKPVSAGQRHLILINRNYLWKGKKIKKLVKNTYNASGRNYIGHKIFRNVDRKIKKTYIFTQVNFFNNVPYLIVSIEYDPNRSSFISLILTKNGLCCYILNTFLTKKNQIIFNNVNKEINLEKITIGYVNKLKYLPIGSLISNISFTFGKKAVFAKAAGNFAQLLKKNINGFCVLKLRSGEKRLINEENIATIGIISNLEHRMEVKSKAGRNIWIGKKPIVRGVAMNPVDHPHGGNTSGGKIWTTPWKKLTKGVKTRKKKKTYLYLI